RICNLGIGRRVGRLSMEDLTQSARRARLDERAELERMSTVHIPARQDVRDLRWNEILVDDEGLMVGLSPLRRARLPNDSPDDPTVLLRDLGSLPKDGGA